ncbi:hypothetical protein SU32_00645 [Ahrensia marina]|uniref:Glycosyltransferase RgtA/B/C/D-like domain-containing protein n=1 Tax=Ahrensia marina TaxID=1514904 RepID=A0A0M9GQ81_9HYPH|nr:hypothetical protein SU32_00645 [Ahrensia marina]
MIKLATSEQSKYYVIASWALLALCVLFPILVFSLPVKIPIGAFYWDSYLYLDAQNRIATGQLPNVDFFPPVGALGYYLFYWLRLVLPESQPMLAASWALIFVTVPLMAVVTWDSLKTNAVTTLLVVLGFAFFTIVPFNTTEYYSYPGYDGFAIYNRQGSQLIYVVAAALLFMRQTWLQGVVIGLAMTALFSIKITAFLAAGLFCAYALLCGKISIRSTIIAIIISAIILAITELTTGIISAYLRDIFELVTSNEGGLIGRLLQGGARTFGVCAPAALAGLLLLFAAKWQRLDHPAIWIFVALAAGVFFESQNTGGQELIFVIPVIVYAMFIVLKSTIAPPMVGVLLLLGAAAALPPIVQTTQHAARATVTALKQAPLEHENLKSMGDVLVRDFLVERETEIRQHWQNYPEAMMHYVELGQLPEFVLFQDFAFQAAWARNADMAVTALLKKEAEGLEYKTIMNMDFTNPFAYLLDKEAPKHVAIGADPTRIVTKLREGEAEALADTDIILVPQCPYTSNIRMLSDIYGPALVDHKEVALSQCHTALIHPRLQADW